MRRKVLLMCTLVLFFLILLLYKMFQFYFVQDVWYQNFDFKVPRPQKVTRVYTNRNNFHGDGISYTKFDYSSSSFEQVRNLGFWKKVSIQDGEFELHLSQITKELSKSPSSPLTKQPIVVNDRSLYFLKKLDDGSYILAILQVSGRTLYVIEWYQ